MKWRLWLLRAGLALILVTILSSAAAAQNNAIGLFFNGQAVDPKIKAISRDQVKFVNLAFLHKYLPAVTDWDPNQDQLKLRFGKLRIKLHQDNLEYTINDATQKLSAAPFEADGQLWLPVEFLLQLGMAVKSQTPQQLDLGWQGHYLLAMESLTYQGRPAFQLVATEPFTCKSFLLAQPERLVLDLAGFKVHPAFDNQINQNQIVRQVRFSQFGPDTVRVVFDLNKLSGYQVLRSPDKPNQATLVFNYFVEAVNLFHQDQDRRVLIRTTYPPQYSVTYFQEPKRLVIDLSGATIAPEVAPFKGDGQWISGVRMSQFQPNVVRVVLDRIGDAPCFVIPSREDPKLLEIRTLQSITGLDWQQDATGGKLIISSNGGIIEHLQKLRDPERLQIDLNYVMADPNLKLPAFENDQVKGIRLLPLSPTSLRIELDLAFYIGYTTKFSPDRHQLTLGFTRSPLIGKLIVIDPGHGGMDPGACGRQGTQEKEVNIEVALQLKQALEAAGAQVLLTRNNDDYLSLYERSFIANQLLADLFISIHTNNHNDFAVQGIEVYHYSGRPELKLLAKKVHDKLVEYTGLGGLGVKTNDFVVIRETQMPGVLIELGYLSNFQEETTIRTTQFRQQAAQGIFMGVLDYYQPAN